MIVLTWNVLHRVHAVNFSEPTLARWPDERARAGSIADFIAASDADVVCLQEVSGDQLAMLRDTERGELFASKYPRVPSYRKHEAARLREPAEYLVTSVRGAGARLVAEHAFPTDGGKGLQCVELANGDRVINTHVSYGERRPAQLARIAAVVREAAGRVVVCGDFNAEVLVCGGELGAELVGARLPPDALPTRPGDRDATIDHAFVRGGGEATATVLDGEGRSDHHPVRIVI